MGREIRIGLMLAASACLMAVLVDWAVTQLNSEATPAGFETRHASGTESKPGDAEQLSPEGTHDATERISDASAESQDQV